MSREEYIGRKQCRVVTIGNGRGKFDQFPPMLNTTVDGGVDGALRFLLELPDGRQAARRGDVREEGAGQERAVRLFGGLVRGRRAKRGRRLPPPPAGAPPKLREGLTETNARDGQREAGGVRTAR